MKFIDALITLLRMVLLVQQKDLLAIPFVETEFTFQEEKLATMEIQMMETGVILAVK